MQLTGTKNYTEPKISPANPTAADMHKDWYVWFRFYDPLSRSWVQKRYKSGINEFKIYRERLKEANALCQVLKEELKDEWNPLIVADPSSVKIYSLGAAIDYILQIKAATLRKKTKYTYEYILKLFKEWLHENNLLYIGARFFTGAQAQQYMDWMLMKKKYSGRTFNDHLIVLRTFFNCFMDREWVVKNPFRAVKRKTQTVGRNLAFTDAEMELIDRELYEKDRRLYYFKSFMQHGFIRRTELTCIKVKHINMLTKTIIIPGHDAKNNFQESVVIPQKLEAIIKEMELHRYRSDDYLFGRLLQTGPTQYKNPNHISARLTKRLKDLKIDSEKGLYSFKHTGVCQYYYATGKDIYSLLRQLRHRDLTTTTIYLKSLGLINNDAMMEARIA